jgi:cytidylate kinase
MSVITIARQFGSLGDEIGRDVAERLGLRLVDQDIINEVAGRLGVPPAAVTQRDERDSHLVGELVRTMRRLYPATIAPDTGENPDVDEAALLQVIRQVTWEIARAGNAVIIGRGAPFILQSHPDLLHVLVTAPLNVRIERVMLSETCDYSQATQRLKDVDSNRTRYARHFYGVNWLDVSHYDLVLNTGHFSQIRATDLICQSAARPHAGVSPDITPSP